MKKEKEQKINEVSEEIRKGAVEIGDNTVDSFENLKSDLSDDVKKFEDSAERVVKRIINLKDEAKNKW